MTALLLLAILCVLWPPMLGILALLGVAWGLLMGWLWITEPRQRR